MSFSYHFRYFFVEKVIYNLLHFFVFLVFPLKHFDVCFYLVCYLKKFQVFFYNWQKFSSWKRAITFEQNKQYKENCNGLNLFDWENLYLNNKFYLLNLYNKILQIIKIEITVFFIFFLPLNQKIYLLANLFKSNLKSQSKRKNY